MNRPSRSRFIHEVDLIQYDTEAQDDTGSVVPTSAIVATGVAALVVDKGGARHMAGRRASTEKHVRVLFPDAQDLDAANAIRHVGTSGRTRILLVDSFRDDLDMGRLWVAECTEFVKAV